MPEVKSLLGFDFGMRNIGVAVGQTLLKTASPLTVIQAKKGQPNWEEIAKLIDTWQPKALVVGEPQLENNPKHPVIKGAEKFAQALEARFHLPVYRVTEHLSTRAAWSLREEQTQGKISRQPIDAIAAQLILETWLNSLDK